MVYTKRRTADPGEISNAAVDEVLHSTPVPSHHADDVNELLPNIDIHSTALKPPVTSMHTHSVTIEIEDSSVFDTSLLSERNRISLVPKRYEIETAGKLSELASLDSRPYGSIWENTIWENSIHVQNNKISFIQGVHQKSITVPDTIDAIRFLVDDCGLKQSVIKTDENLGLDDSLFGEF